MSGMVKRVARAINERGNKKYNLYMLGVDECLDLARAAIEAMRSPTGKMRDAGRCGTACDCSSDALGMRAEDCWQAMIDAALEGK